MASRLLDRVTNWQNMGHSWPLHIFGSVHSVTAKNKLLLNISRIPINVWMSSLP